MAYQSMKRSIIGLLITQFKDLKVMDGTIEVDGHNIEEISQAIKSSKQESEKPSMIFCKTTIGFGSPNKSGTSGVHGSPLGDEEIVKTRKALNWEHAHLKFLKVYMIFGILKR